MVSHDESEITHVSSRIINFDVTFRIDPAGVERDSRQWKSKTDADGCRLRMRACFLVAQQGVA